MAKTKTERELRMTQLCGIQYKSEEYGPGRSSWKISKDVSERPGGKSLRIYLGIWSLFYRK